jgi:P4 family phage/plasmid primase-like protien
MVADLHRCGTMASAERGQAGTWRWFGFWSEPDLLDLAETLRHLPTNDRQAVFLIRDDLWPGELHHVPDWKRSFAWDGKCHRPDQSAVTEKRVWQVAGWLEKLIEKARQAVAAQVTNRMAGATQEAVDKAIGGEWEKWKLASGYAASLSKTSGHTNLMKAILELCAATPDDMADRFPKLLNCDNGIIDLTTKELWAHDPAAMMTYCVPAAYVPVRPGEPAPCPMFLQLLWRACGEDAEVARYLLHALGYALLGDNRYRLMFFLSGPTSSGKTTLLEIVSEVLGPELAHRAKPELITTSAKGEPRHGRHEASIRGMRLVTIGESNDQLKLDENQIKILTGQPKMSANVLWEKTLTPMDIAALVFIANNAMPRIDHLDEALQQRIWVIPMGQTIPEDQRDGEMAARILSSERDGILAVLVDACSRVLASGGSVLTSPPAAVVAKTGAYERDQNTVLLWLAEDAVTVNGSSPAVRGSDCLRLYRPWCEANRREALGSQHFYAALAALDGVTRTTVSEQPWFYGFALRQPPSDYA